MINSIKLIQCTPYQQAELTDCKKINFVFGANGSGKTTISSFLAGIEDDRFSKSIIEWDNTEHETIYVYNRTFRRKNFQQTIPGVFTMGSATIDDVNALEKMKQELAQKKEQWEVKCASYNKIVQKEIPAREDRFKEETWSQILKPNEVDFQKAFEGVRGSKDKFLKMLKDRILGIHGHEGHVCEKKDLLARAKTLYSGNPGRCERFTLDIDNSLEKIEEIRTNPIWDKAIVGNSNVDIASLIEELRNTSWVDKGRQYIRQNSRVCPFCQQETITDEFMAKLTAFFDTDYKPYVDEMKILLEEYCKATDQIVVSIETAIQNEESLGISKLDTGIYAAKKERIKSICFENTKKISEKIEQPVNTAKIAEISSEIQDIKNLLNNANATIDAHNSLLEARDIEETKLTDDVWKTIIHSSDALIKSYQKDISGLENAKKSIGDKCDSLKSEIDKLETDVIEKGKNITSVQPTIDEINKSLKAYGFNNFTIQPAEGFENAYCIKREDGTLATDTLSEGEETFLTFLYFMQWTKGSIDPEHVSDKKIIVLDDPISSLDSTILYIVGSMVKELSKSIRQDQGDVTQLFVLTHNVFFHKEASFIDGRTKELGEVHYWIVRKDDGISTIKEYGMKNPISTAYELLWAELRDNDNLSQITIQNTMRRILENYFGMLGNRIDETLVESFDELEERMIARSLIAWINDGSHSIPDDLYIDSYTDAVPKYKEVFRKMFEKTEHIAHYNMMMKISDEIPEQDNIQ